MNEITRILASIEEGYPLASEQLVPLVYEELRRLASSRLAREHPGQTLQTTELVHEAWLRLTGGEEVRWSSKRHFLGAAAEAMRRILINRARDKRRLKRGGDRRRLELDRLEVAVEAGSEELLALDVALERLERQDALTAELVKLRFFAGLTQGEAARALDLPRRTADRYWAYARVWLYGELERIDGA